MHTYKHKNLKFITDNKINSINVENNTEEVFLLKNQIKELLSDFDRLKIRSEEEKRNSGVESQKETILKFLPIVDNLMRATELVEDEGIKAILKQTLTILSDFGVYPIDALGKEFDYSKHMSISHIEDDTDRVGIVVKEFQKGYTYNGTILRYSIVEVVN